MRPRIARFLVRGRFHTLRYCSPTEPAGRLDDSHAP